MHCPACGRCDLKMEIQGSRAENSVVLFRSGVFIVLVVGGWSHQRHGLILDPLTHSPTVASVEVFMGAGEGGFLLLM